MLDKLQSIPGFWQKYQNLFKKITVPANTILLNEGETSKYLYFIQQGCLRAWFNKDGKDITTQFFFENQAVSSMESYFNKTPSLLTIEAIEPSVLFALNKANFDTLFKEVPQLKDGFQKFLLQRLGHCAKLFLSRIKDTPRERYLDLLKNNPDILKRVPQHYIASYLGITSVSLSRIKNKK
jgi:CRP-like cAMP-binding protein